MYFVIRSTETVTRAGAFRLRWALLALCTAGSLTACAPLPTEADSERLDTDTGTTVTLMPRPVELIITQPKAGKTDPFAYLAPILAMFGVALLLFWLQKDLGPALLFSTIIAGWANGETGSQPVTREIKG